LQIIKLYNLYEGNRLPRKKAYKSLQFLGKRVAQLEKLGKYSQKDQYYLENGEKILGKPKYAIKTSVKL